MTEQEKIPSFTEALSLYLSGEKVEMKESGADNWYKMARDCLNSSVLDLMSCDYRKKPEPKTRLMTAEELIGKVIICKYQRTMMRGEGIYRHLVSSCDEESVYMPHMDKMWVEIKGINDFISHSK